MSKIELTAEQKRALRAKAHILHPVVMVGDRGLTDNLIAEIDRSLNAHELIKIQVAGSDRDERINILNEICKQLNCAEVQHIGKILVIYRAKEITDSPQATAKRPKNQPYISKKQAAAKQLKRS